MTGIHNILVPKTVVLLSVLLLSGCMSSRPVFVDYLNKDGELGIARHPAIETYRYLDPLPALYSLDLDSSVSELAHVLEFRSRDMRAYGPELSPQILDLCSFDSKTLWPESLVAKNGDIKTSFNPLQSMHLGANPGPGIKDLHKKSITGKGIKMAIIDSPLLVDHQEYAQNLLSYEEIHQAPNIRAGMHGGSVAAIALGKTVGVAPEAELVYLAANPGDWNHKTQAFDRHWFNIIRALKRIQEINTKFSREDRIRVVSISMGINPEEPGAQELFALIQEMDREGVLVLTVNSSETHQLSFFGAGRKAILDPEDFSNYEIGRFGKENLRTDILQGRLQTLSWLERQILAPMDSRTSASPTGTTDYGFYPTGAMSWVVPWFAGVYCLGSQVYPELDPQTFARALAETSKQVYTIIDGTRYKTGKMADVGAFIHYVEELSVNSSKL